MRKVRKKETWHKNRKAEKNVNKYKKTRNKTKSYTKNGNETSSKGRTSKNRDRRFCLIWILRGMKMQIKMMQQIKKQKRQ